VSDIGDIRDEVVELTKAASKVKPHDAAAESYRQGYTDALSEVYDILVLYMEEED